MTFDDLTSGDRFTSGTTLWTKLDPSTARRHSPEGLGLRASGHGYHGDAICSFERTDEVVFVEPLDGSVDGARRALEMTIGALQGALKGLGAAEESPAAAATAAVLALSWPAIPQSSDAEPLVAADAPYASDTAVKSIISIVQAAAQTIATHAPLDRAALKLSICEALAAIDVAGRPLRADYQSRVKSWVVACFGPEVLEDRRERTHRFTEEALQLSQACGATQEEVLLLVDYVYGRPVGDIANEVGGVMTTLSALNSAHGIDLSAAAEAELAQVWLKKDRIRQKWLSKPNFSPLPGVYSDVEKTGSTAQGALS